MGNISGYLESILVHMQSQTPTSRLKFLTLYQPEKDSVLDLSSQYMFFTLDNFLLQLLSHA